MLSGCFCLGYKIGFHFTAVRHDAGNALIVNSGPDMCAVGVQVDYSQVHAGILFQNCQINAGVIVNEGSLGPVKFMNCGLFGTGVAPLPYLELGDRKATHAMLKGQGRATFIGCHFYQPEGPFVPKDFVDPGHPAIYGDGAGLTLASCGKLVSQHLSTAICRLRGATAWLWRNHLYRRCSRLCRENH